MEPNEADILEAADRIGVSLDDAETASFLEATRVVAGFVDRLDINPPESTPAKNVREGNDEYNAFRYRFSLEADTGELADLDVAVKDNMAVSGVPMTCGSEAVEYTPSVDATVVSRLRSRGANVLGTTEMDEFALYGTGETCAHGPIRNPAAEGRVPGGSSSGSGAAVGAGYVDVGLGSDTGGSIRIPASFCGVVGFKPTHRLVPRSGFADLSPTLDHVGPLANSVENACRVLDAISGPAIEDPSTHVTRQPTETTASLSASSGELTVGVVQETLDVATSGVRNEIENTLSALADEGWTVEPISIPPFNEAVYSVLGISGPEFSRLVQANGQNLGTGTGYRNEWRAELEQLDWDDLGDNTRTNLIAGETLFTASQGEIYVRAQSFRECFIEEVLTALEGVDALVTPTTKITAPEFGELTGVEGLIETIQFTSPFNLTGQPALSVPAGSVDGRPVGLQIVADWHQDDVVARIGQKVERLPNY